MNPDGSNKNEGFDAVSAFKNALANIEFNEPHSQTHAFRIPQAPKSDYVFTVEGFRIIVARLEEAKRTESALARMTADLQAQTAVLNEFCIKIKDAACASPLNNGHRYSSEFVLNALPFSTYLQAGIQLMEDSNHAVEVANEARDRNRTNLETYAQDNRLKELRITELTQLVKHQEKLIDRYNTVEIQQTERRSNKEKEDAAIIHDLRMLVETMDKGVGGSDEGTIAALRARTEERDRLQSTLEFAAEANTSKARRVEELEMFVEQQRALIDRYDKIESANAQRHRNHLQALEQQNESLSRVIAELRSQIAAIKSAVIGEIDG